MLPLLRMVGAQRHCGGLDGRFREVWVLVVYNCTMTYQHLGAPYESARF